MISQLISVIIPAYNHAKYLSEAIQSVLNQTYQNFEILIVDDGSTDNTRQVVQNYTDQRIKYIYQENRGLAASRNAGLRVTQGEYVAFLDADDIFLPHKLEVQLDWFEAHPSCGMVFSGFYFMNDRGEPIKTFSPWVDTPTLEVKDLLFINPTSVHAILVKKHWVDQVGGFDEKFRRIEDWDMWLRMAYGGCKVEWVKEIVCGYRLSSDQMTKNATAQKQVSMQVMDKFFQQDDLPVELRELQTKVNTNIYLHFAPQEYGYGQCEEAKESVTQAIRLAPDLLGKRQSELLNRLVLYAFSPTNINDPIDYTKCIFDNLPEEAATLKTKKRWGLGRVSVETFFIAYQSTNWHQVRRAGLMMALNAPYRMLNRGVWSILWQSLGK